MNGAAGVQKRTGTRRSGRDDVVSINHASELSWRNIVESRPYVQYGIVTTSDMVSSRASLI